MHIFFRLIITILATLPLSQNGLLHAQAPVGTDALWSELEEQIQKGNRRALRDLATFLDKPLYAEPTRQTLQRYTFFTPKEINVATATRESFLVFFYENEQRLKFSEILKAFYCTPVEEQTVDSHYFSINATEAKQNLPPSVILIPLSEKFDSILQKDPQSIDIQNIVEQIAELKTNEAYDWLRRTLSAEVVGKQYSDLYQTLCESLKNDPSQETMQTILKAVEHGLVRPELLSSVFLSLTNIAVSLPQTQKLLDTFGHLDAVRAYGYDHSLSFREAYFFEKVDYYGKILSSPNAPHWIQNSGLHDLLQTRHPRLLFFLAAQTRLKPDEKEKYIALLEKLTHKTAVFYKNSDDIEKWKNFVRWWSIHYTEFEWDNTTERFISRDEMTARTEEVERLMRRLSSPNDSVALGSFQQLTEHDPSVVAAMMEKYRPLLRGYNAQLPELNYPFLENLSLLVSYCQTRKIAFQLSQPLRLLWGQLLKTITPKERYHIENQIIKDLKLKDITALEYNGLLLANHTEINFSVSRIVDIFYSKHWKEVVLDENNLRLYVKKMVLFERIGAGGSSSFYAKRLDITDKNLCARLEKIARTESDSTIRHGILRWLKPVVVRTDDDLNEVKTVEKKRISIENLIETLDSSPEILIDEINEMVLHQQFSDKQKSLLLKFLKKVTPLSSIRHFTLKNYFMVQNDLSFFNDMVIAPKDLDDFLSIFNLTEEENASQAEQQLWQFVNKQTAQYSLDEVGSFWNTMFKIRWFNNLIYDGAMLPSQRDTIINTMRNYLTNSELLSDFEEQTTQMHLAELENIGRSLTDKLKNVLELDANTNIKAAVQSAILARVSYEDIPTVVAMADQLTTSNNSESPLRFLQTDFGLPIFSDDKEALTEFIINHKKMTPKELYSFYLKKFGLNLWNTEGGLDYEKIYDVLKHESIVPFIGGGAQRNYFTYGVIKLLEFEFGTRFGFHEKLNENQTFYTYNTSKRAIAWRQFLVDKRIVSQ